MNNAVNTPVDNLTAICTAYMEWKLEGKIGIRKGKTDKEGAETLARQAGATSDKSKRAASVFFPPPYDAELAAVTAAYGAVRAEFDAKAAFLGVGRRGRTTTQEVAMPFDLVLKPQLDALAAARQKFIDTLPQRVQEIQRSGARGDQFDPADYPTPEELASCFTYEMHGPLAFASVEAIESLPLTKELSAACAAASKRYADKMVAESQQDLATELTKYVGVMAKNLSELVKFRDGQSPGRKKAPKISEGMIANITNAVQRARDFAIPSTPAGKALLALADQIVEQLQVDCLDADDFKDEGNLPLTRSIAVQAAVLVQAIEEMPVFG